MPRIIEAAAPAERPRRATQAINDDFGFDCSEEVPVPQVKPPPPPAALPRQQLRRKHSPSPPVRLPVQPGNDFDFSSSSPLHIADDSEPRQPALRRVQARASSVSPSPLRSPPGPRRETTRFDSRDRDSPQESRMPLRMRVPQPPPAAAGAGDDDADDGLELSGDDPAAGSQRSAGSRSSESDAGFRRRRPAKAAAASRTARAAGGAAKAAGAQRNKRSEAGAKKQGYLGVKAAGAAAPAPALAARAAPIRAGAGGPVIVIDDSDDEDDGGSTGHWVSDVAAAAAAAVRTQARREAARAKKAAKDGAAAAAAAPASSTPAAARAPPPPSRTPRGVSVLTLRYGRAALALPGYGASCLVTDAVAALCAAAPRASDAATLEVVSLDGGRATYAAGGALSSSDLAEEFGPDCVLQCAFSDLKSLLGAEATRLVVLRPGAAACAAPQPCRAHGSEHAWHADCPSWGTIASSDVMVTHVPAFLELVDVIDAPPPVLGAAAARAALLRQRSISITPPRGMKRGSRGESAEEEDEEESHAHGGPVGHSGHDARPEPRHNHGSNRDSHGHGGVRGRPAAAALVPDARVVTYRFVLHAVDASSESLFYVCHGGASGVQLRLALSAARSSLAARADALIAATSAVAAPPPPKPRAAPAAAKRKRETAAAAGADHLAAPKPRDRATGKSAAARADISLLHGAGGDPPNSSTPSSASAVHGRFGSSSAAVSVPKALTYSGIGGAAALAASLGALANPPGAGSRFAPAAFRPAVPDADGWLGR